MPSRSIVTGMPFLVMRGKTNSEVLEAGQGNESSDASTTSEWFAVSKSWRKCEACEEEEKKKKNISLKELREQRAQQNGEAGKNVDGGKKTSVVQPQKEGGARKKNNKKNKKKGQKAPKVPLIRKKDAIKT